MKEDTQTSGRPISIVKLALQKKLLKDDDEVVIGAG